jgi:hypothetical protein
MVIKENSANRTSGMHAVWDVPPGEEGLWADQKLRPEKESELYR